MKETKRKERQSDEQNAVELQTKRIPTQKSIVAFFTAILSALGLGHISAQDIYNSPSMIRKLDQKRFEQLAGHHECLAFIVLMALRTPSIYIDLQLKAVARYEEESKAIDFTTYTVAAPPRFCPCGAFGVIQSDGRCPSCPGRT